MQFKWGLVNCLLNRAWKICSTRISFEKDLSSIFNVLLANGYPYNFLNSCKNHFLNHVSQNSKDPQFGPEKKKIFFSLPYAGTDSLKLKRQLLRLVNAINPGFQPIVIFKPVCKLASLICHAKSRLPLLSKNNVVYQINCDNCDAYYIGLTQRRLADRFQEHHTSDKSNVFRHCHEKNHTASQIKVLTTEHSREKLYIKESLFIQSIKPLSLNKDVTSLQLNLW